MNNTIKDNSTRSQNAIYALMAVGIVDIISIGLGFYENKVYKGYEYGEYSDEFLENLDIVILSLSLVTIAVFITTAVLFIKWFRRAYSNLIALNTSMEYTENGAVWGYFIPFVNWVRPIKTGKEIYLKTQKIVNGSDHIDSDTSFISIWWIVYLLNGFFANFVSRIYTNAGTIDEIISANNLYIYSDMFDLVAVGLAIIFVRKVAKVELELKENDNSKSLIDQIGLE